MPLIDAGALADLPPGTAIQINSSGEYAEGVAVCNVAGELFAIDGICPHSAGPIGDGALHGYTLVCPWHAWEFDCRTGRCNVDDDLVQARYQVKVVDGRVLVEVPETGVLD